MVWTRNSRMKQAHWAMGLGVATELFWGGFLYIKMELVLFETF